MSSYENSDFSESELEVRVQKSYAQLKEGGLFQKNADGTFKCPFCLGKKKQDYRYKDILQHANGVANSPKSLEKAAKHRGLEMILMEDAEQLKPFGPPMIDSRLPKRVRLERKEERFVWPWMAIVANIPTALENWVYVTNGKLKAQFSEFNPAKNEATVAEEQARQHIKNLVRDAWRKLNKELLSAQQQWQQQAGFSCSFLNVAVNIERLLAVSSFTV
ncbi:Factor of DNA methylation 1 [Nymphaea thermarum]|nr:Factor of DNA methylation 1 [Nymphaea thermarum]